MAIDLLRDITVNPAGELWVGVPEESDDAAFFDEHTVVEDEEEGVEDAG